MQMDLSGHEGEIPNPITSTYVAHNPSTKPTNNNTESPNNNRQIVLAKAVRYKECLKNHAASMGGNALDGCGEFMPSGDEGTIEALKCSACNCHRNFHRKEVEGEPSSYYKARNPFGFNIPTRAQAPALIMPLGAIHNNTSESDEIEEGYGFGGEMVRAPNPIMKKRFRTKFSQEQKERMMDFAEKVGWKLQRQEESLVQQFCHEIGVKRKVLKVWMHNNKHNLAKKSSTPQIQ